jgi:hypothetical protein
MVEAAAKLSGPVAALADCKSQATIRRRSDLAVGVLSS